MNVQARKDLTVTEKAVFELLQAREGLATREASPYLATLRTLMRAGLVALKDRKYVVATRAHLKEQMVSIAAWVPKRIADELDAIGPTRSEAIRMAIDIALHPAAK